MENGGSVTTGDRPTWLPKYDGNWKCVVAPLTWGLSPATGLRELQKCMGAIGVRWLPPMGKGLSIMGVVILDNEMG